MKHYSAVFFQFGAFEDIMTQEFRSHEFLDKKSQRFRKSRLTL